MGLSVDVVDADGPPQVWIEVTGIPTGGVLTVERTWDGGRSWHPVRGADRTQPENGFASFRDWACPLNTPSVYRARLDVGQNFTDNNPNSLNITVPATRDVAWLQNAIDPQAGVRLALRRDVLNTAGTLVVGTAQAAQWEQAQDMVQILGASLPLVSLGMRSREMFAPINILANTSGTDQIMDLLMSAGVLLLRGGPPPFQASTWITLPDVGQRILPGGAWNVLTATAHVTREPAATISIAFWTYADVTAMIVSVHTTLPTYTDMTVLSPPLTYAQAARDPQLLGNGY